MLNAEKYKKDVEKVNYCFAVTHEKKIVECKIGGIPCSECIFNDKSNEITCEQAKMWWLGKEYPKPLLTDEEKIIIKNIIKAFEPFGAEVQCIAKYRQGDEPTDYYLNFNYKNHDELDTFTFNGNELFVGMEVDELYTLEELGL